MGTARSALISTSAEELVAAHPAEPGRVRPHRTLDGDGYKIRTLSMGAGAVMREHKAPVPILVQVVSGRVEFRVEATQYELAAGGAIQVDANVPHELQTAEGAHLLLILLG